MKRSHPVRWRRLVSGALIALLLLCPGCTPASTPVEDPAEPVDAPTAPVEAPTVDPVTEPTEPVEEPAEPVEEPVETPAEPMEPPAEPITFPAEYPQISFDVWPLGVDAAEAVELLGSDPAILEQLESAGQASAGISTEAFEARGGMLSLLGVTCDHVHFLYRDGKFYSVAYYYYLRQFESREAFFDAVVAWHAVLSETLTAASFAQDSLLLADLRSGDDYEDDARQATFWTRDNWQLQMTLTGVGNKTCCTVLLCYYEPSDVPLVPEDW